MKTSLPYAHNFKLLNAPANITGGMTGGRLKVANCSKIVFLIAIASGTAGTFTFTLKQHDAASSGNSKVCAINGAYYHKVGSATTMTKVDVAEGSEASAFVLGSTVSTSAALVAFEIDASQLDVSGGYYWASVDAASVGQDRYVSVVGILTDSDFKPAYDIATA